MGQFIDLSGRVFSRLTVLSLARTQRQGRRVRHFWECQCACGNIKIVNGDALKTSNTQSCGCLHREICSKIHGTHRLRSHPLYRAWKSMHARCRDSGNPYYGARGIHVCERWSGRNGFTNFIADMGEQPDGKTLDRINATGDYSPENCRWATLTEQSNNRSNTIILTLDGVTLCLQDWAKRLGIPAETIRQRIRKLGWSVEKALSYASLPRKTGA